MNNVQKIIAGTALVTLLGSLAFLANPRRRNFIDTVTDHTSNLTNKAKDYADNLINKGKSLTSVNHIHDNRNSYIKGSLTGLLFGTGATLLFTPKSGKQLRNQLNKTYEGLFGTTQKAIRKLKNNAHAFHPLDNNQEIGNIQKVRRKRTAKVKTEKVKTE